MKKALVAPLIASLCFLSLVALHACEEEDVGIPCKMSTGGGGDDAGPGGQGAQVNSKGLDCRSRLCLYVAGVEEARPQCTRICESNSDCPDETETCKEGYSCAQLVTTGALKCCKMCVCKRFLSGSSDAGTATPLACQGYTATCPSL